MDKGLEGIEKARFSVGTDEDAVGVNLQQVALVAYSGVGGVVNGKGDAILVWSAYEGGTHVHLPSAGGNILGRGTVLPKVLEAEPSAGGEGEDATFLHQVDGLRYDEILLNGHGVAARCGEQQQG